jgi:hypothetical protein
MGLQIQVVPAADPRNPHYRWTVSSRGADDAFVRIVCHDTSRGMPDDPLAVTVAEIEIPREVAGMLAITIVHDQVRAGM